MELRLDNGDYVPDGQGGLQRLWGAEEVLQRTLFRLTVRRGSFPFLPELGSRLYLLPRERPSAREARARQYVAEALAGETGLEVTEVVLTQGEGGRLEVTVGLEWQGQALTAAVTV